MSCSGSLKKGRFGYQWQAALALVGPIYDTSVESTIFAGNRITITTLYYVHIVVVHTSPIIDSLACYPESIMLWLHYRQARGRLPCAGCRCSQGISGWPIDSALSIDLKISLNFLTQNPAFFHFWQNKNKLKAPRCFSGEGLFFRFSYSGQKQ